MNQAWFSFNFIVSCLVSCSSLHIYQTANTPGLPPRSPETHEVTDQKTSPSSRPTRGSRVMKSYSSILFVVYFYHLERIIRMSPIQHSSCFDSGFCSNIERGGSWGGGEQEIGVIRVMWGSQDEEGLHKEMLFTSLGYLVRLFNKIDEKNNLHRKTLWRIEKNLLNEKMTSSWPRFGNDIIFIHISIALMFQLTSHTLILSLQWVDN